MKRRIAAVIAVIGALVVGNHLASIWPRELEVAYSIDPAVAEVDVDYLQEGDAVASVRFKQSDAKSTIIRHAVRLQPGEYELRITLYSADGQGVEQQRRLQVPAEGLTRFDLKETTERSE
jgi:hypothetical protein